MSGQMADVIRLNDEEFALVEPGPGELFDPIEHGLAPVMMHTANTRGVLARYRIDQNRLVLDDLQIGHISEPPAVNGVEPTTDEFGQVWSYHGLGLPIDWTGDLIIGTDLVDELYIHAGFSPVWHYQRVLALDIEDGRVVGTEDRSEQVADYRDDHEDDDNAFERFLKSIRLRLPFGDDD